MLDHMRSRLPYIHPKTLSYPNFANNTFANVLKKNKKKKKNHRKDKHRRQKERRVKGRSLFYDHSALQLWFLNGESRSHFGPRVYPNAMRLYKKKRPARLQLVG